MRVAAVGPPDIVALHRRIIGLAGAEQAIPAEYLEPLGGLVFWGEGSGDVQRFTLFLGIG